MFAHDLRMSWRAEVDTLYQTLYNAISAGVYHGTEQNRLSCQ